MTEIGVIESPAGNWLTLSDEEGVTLNAFLPATKEPSPPGVTVYWPATSVAKPMYEFFAKSLPVVREGSDFPHSVTQLLAYSHGSLEPTQYDIRDLWGDFSQFEFIRFEHYGRARKKIPPLEPQRFEGRPLRHGNARIERPILIAWANLDAGRKDNVPHDAAGVLFMSRHLTGLQKRLAQMIATTSVERPDLASILALIRALDDYLRPDETPMALTA